MTDFAGIRSRLVSQVLAFNEVAPADQQISASDLLGASDPLGKPVVQPNFADGILEQRADGAVRLVGYERRIEEARRSSDPKRQAWAAQKNIKRWWFILAGIDGNDGVLVTKEIQFQIGANCSNAQQKMAFFGYDANATELTKRAASFEAWEFARHPDPNVAWIQGAPIPDAGSFPAGNANVAPATPAESYEYARIHEETWIKGHLWGPGFGFGPK